MPDLVGLDAAADAGVWERLGFAVVDRVSMFGRVAIRLGVPGQKISGWALDGVMPGTDVDGLMTTTAPPAAADRAPHPNGTLAIDHLVVLSLQPARTIAALAAIGLDVRGERHTDQYGPPYTQTFFRMGRPILELIGPDTPTDDGPARFFGLAFTVADLDATAEFFGDRLGRVKDAVQPGRRIATLRRHAWSPPQAPAPSATVGKAAVAEAGAGLPLAFMSEGASSVDLQVPGRSGT